MAVYVCSNCLEANCDHCNPPRICDHCFAEFCKECEEEISTYTGSLRPSELCKACSSREEFIKNGVPKPSKKRAKSDFIEIKGKKIPIEQVPETLKELGINIEFKGEANDK